jgi:hypothetical protein
VENAHCRMQVQRGIRAVRATPIRLSSHFLSACKKEDVEGDAGDDPWGGGDFVGGRRLGHGGGPSSRGGWWDATIGASISIIGSQYRLFRGVIISR